MQEGAFDDEASNLNVLMSHTSFMSTALGSSPGEATQVAASVEYDFVARPTGLSPDFDQRAFEGNEEPLADAITKWLAELHL